MDRKILNCEERRFIMIQYSEKEFVGKRMEEIITQKGLTKIQVCKEAGISRPTLDKFIEGNILNERNFYKYLKMLLDYFKISSEQEFKGYFIETKPQESKHFSSDIAYASEVTGISEEHIREIMQGADATREELQELALCFRTSTRGVQNKHYFENVENVPRCNIIGAEYENGICGYIEIQLAKRKDKLIYPITELTKDSVKWQLNQEFLVVPCLNNRLLLINRKHLKYIKLYTVGHGKDNGISRHEETSVRKFLNERIQNFSSFEETPLVVYEVYKKYGNVTNEKTNKDDLTKLEREIFGLLRKEYVRESYIKSQTSLTEIYYDDGTWDNIVIDFNKRENLTTNIKKVQEWIQPQVEDELYMEGEAGEYISYNTERIAIMDIPLLQIEDALLAREEIAKQEQKHLRGIDLPYHWNNTCSH